jgi:hypothetical protein
MSAGEDAMQIYTSYDKTTGKLNIDSGTTTEVSSGNVTTANSSTDTADWSEAALSLSESDSSGLVSPVLQLNAENEILQQHLTSALATKFDEAGIDTSQTITLTRDADGNVVVAGDNADKDAIEQIFADEPSLTEAFNTLADNSALAKSYTKSQTTSLVRTNGYSAYLQQLQDSSSSTDGTSASQFYLSLLSDYSTTYFS